jgi:large subunit ribosomal protein L23
MSGPKQRRAGRGLELAPHQVVIRPLVNEKAMAQATHLNQYTFEVHPEATKADIKRAVEELFQVKVVAVRTQNRLGKPRRFRFQQGRTRSWKKAIVALDQEYRITLV